MSPYSINWLELESLAKRLADIGVEPGSIAEGEWRPLIQTLDDLLAANNAAGILRLRELFTPLLARDTFWGVAILQQLDEAAIQAARVTSDKAALAHLLGARGHNLHRQGYHQASIHAFDESAALYWEIGDSFPALKSNFMTALCFRALGDRARAYQVVAGVLEQTIPEDPWRGNPLQFMAWLIRDEGRLLEAEQFLQEAIQLHERTDDPDILVAGALADLGEIIGLQGRWLEARGYFEQSLSILLNQEGQYDRQEARTRLKFAELLIRMGDDEQALQLLAEADDKVRTYGHYYDLMWRIEIARMWIYLRQGRLHQALRKLRAARHFRRELGLPNTLLIRPIISRMLRLRLPGH